MAPASLDIGPKISALVEFGASWAKYIQILQMLVCLSTVEMVHNFPLANENRPFFSLTKLNAMAPTFQAAPFSSTFTWLALSMKTLFSSMRIKQEQLYLARKQFGLEDKLRAPLGSQGKIILALKKKMLQ